jgi:hypothetical protein
MYEDSPLIKAICRVRNTKLKSITHTTTTCDYLVTDFSIRCNFSSKHYKEVMWLAEELLEDEIEVLIAKVHLNIIEPSKDERPLLLELLQSLIEYKE